MRRTTRAVGAALLLSALAACAPDSDDSSDTVGLAPTFPPGTAAGSTTSSAVAVVDGTAAPTPGAPTTTGAVAGGSGEVAGPPPSAAPTPIVPTTAGVADPSGDATPSVGAPQWADLVGGRLTRGADGYELRIALRGGAAPTSSGGDDRTMNIASFYDIDGDGSIDYEVWANLASGGWGGSWFDNRAGEARFVDESGVAISVEGAEVVLRFPLSHLGGAERFRWSVASEWGPVAALGTDLTARDDMPDDDAPADFPA